MDIRPKHWIIFTLLAVIGTVVWFQYSYPRYVTIDLSIDRLEAKKISSEFLKNEIGVDPDGYMSATAFIFDRSTDRYLQKAIGFKGETEFLEEHEFELFFWVTRFFREKEQEEFKVTVSCKTGEVTSFSHAIEESKEGKKLSRDKALELGKNYLQERFDIDFSDHVIKADLSTENDFRIDYTFSWEKKGVAIPWTDKKEDGKAKLLVGVHIAGDEVVRFSKFKLTIPERFHRYLAEQQSLGWNFLTIIRIFQILIFVGAIFYIIVRRNHLAMHTTKRFYIGLAIFLYFLNILSEFNQFEYILLGYNTTQPMDAHFTRYAINTLVHFFFITIGILMPALSGESLHYEVFKNRREGRMLYYLRTTFFNRDLFYRISLGYLVCILLLGFQSLAVQIGQTYFGVWVENTWIVQLSSTYLPFFAAFVIGIKASLFEEIIFRLFSISWLKKLLKNTVIAVVLSALIWGFSHSGYLVFPMWFRGVEVSIIGIIFGFVFLRFGFIPVLVAHYVFDCFWASSGFLFGKSDPFYFWTSIGVIFLPMLWGVAAFLINRPVDLSRLRWRLTKQQAFNLGVLKSYLSDPTNIKDRTPETLRQNLISSGWDIAVVETVFDELGIEPMKEDIS